jgi:hypothetical protein
LHHIFSVVVMVVAVAVVAVAFGRATVARIGPTGLA